MSDPHLPALIGGRYKPIREIGRGGMGIVYEVEHLHTGERLALKLLVSQSNASGDSVDRFKREARASAQIKSDNVVRVTDADVASEADGAPFIVMELLEGTDLDLATKTQPQAPINVVEWLRQVARALDKAHGLGIVHRDLKPENLFLTQHEDGTPFVKILDFGIVKMVTEDDGTTQEGQVLGTPMYMAPEQINREGSRVSPATDRYALGLIAHKLLTGRHYREGETLVQVVADVMRGRVVPPSQRGSTCGRQFDVWFGQACHPDPLERFPSAGEQVEALARVFGLPTKPVDMDSTRLPAGAFKSTSTLESAPTLEVEARELGTGNSGGGRRMWVIAAAAAVAVAFTVALVVSQRQAAVRATGVVNSYPIVGSGDPLASSEAAPTQLDATLVGASSSASALPAPEASSASTAPDHVPTLETTRPRPLTVSPPPPKTTRTPSDPLAEQK